MKYYFLFISLLLAICPIKAQELNCTVIVNSDQIQGTNRNVFNTLQSSITDFMNSRKWTDMSFTNNERIDCTISMIISEYNESDNNFSKVEITVQSRRPVYGTSYYSPMLNFRDTYIDFTYQEFDQLEYMENVFTTNLAAILAYYAYIIIGYDMDSYSRLGGTPYFQKAENIATSAQSTDYEGWKAYGSGVRYNLTNNLLDEAFRKFRNYFYEYHRLGLDEMAVNATNGRAKIAEGIPLVREANRARPSGIAVTAFMDAKSDELANIFSEGPKEQRKEVYDILMDISPTRGTQFERIIK